MTITAKFGGTSLCNAQAFDRAAEILHQNPHRRYIVVSAPGKRFSQDTKITDALSFALRTKDLSSVFYRFREIISDLQISYHPESDFSEMEKALRGPGKEAFLISRGEYLCAKIMAAYIGFPFLDAAEGICFHTDGTPDLPKTVKKLRSLLESRRNAVVPGYYGADKNTNIHLFSRGGSDITGALIAVASHSDLYENWTDVDGVLAANPKTVDNPRFLNIITFDELSSLSTFGAEVLHPDAIAPVKEAGIPICIRNSRFSSHPGTSVTAKREDKEPFVGISSCGGFSLICIVGKQSEENIKKIKAVLQDNGIRQAYLFSQKERCLIAVPSQEEANIVNKLYSALF